MQLVPKAQQWLEKAGEEDSKTHHAVRKAVRFIDRLAGKMSPRDDDALGESRFPIARGPIVFGLWTFLVVFGGAGLWSALAPIDSAAVARGLVVLDADKKVVQHLEGGIVEEILVHEGMAVKEGQPLIRLSQTAAKSKNQLQRAQWESQKAMEARLVAERDGKETLEFPEALLKDKDNPTVKDAIDSQSRLFESRKKALEGQLGILDQRIEQFKDEIDGLQSQVKSSDDQLSLLNEEISAVRKLLQSGNAVKPRLLALQRKQAELEGSKGDAMARIARAKQSISEAELEKVNTHNDFMNKLVGELKDVQVQLATLEEQLSASQDVLDRITITAPQSGIVTGLKVHTRGGVIGAGDPIMFIVPQDDQLIVEAHVNPQDIDVVHQGLKARVRLTAYRTRFVPPVEGEVLTISPDRFVNDKTGEAYYTARIQVDQDQFKHLKDVILYPGMPADVLIVTGSRTLFGFLFSSITDIFYKSMREQ